MNATLDNQLTVTVHPKKGESIALRFLVVQGHPWPDLCSTCGQLAWRNYGGLFGQYNHPAEGIGATYHCYLLAENVEVPANFNRSHFAGYEGNRGSLTLRGRDLGELTVKLDKWGDSLKVRGFESPTPTECDFIRAQIVPALKTFVAEHRGALLEQAREKIVRQMHSEISEARERLNELEEQINDIKL